MCVCVSVPKGLKNNKADTYFAVICVHTASHLFSGAGFQRRQGWERWVGEGASDLLLQGTLPMAGSLQLLAIVQFGPAWLGRDSVIERSGTPNPNPRGPCFLGWGMPSSTPSLMQCCCTSVCLYRDILENSLSTMILRLTGLDQRKHP